MAKLTPVKAIRAKCLDCCNGQAGEVRLCPATGCVLHEYRMGHRPKKEGAISAFSSDGETDDKSSDYEVKLENSDYT